MIQKKRGLGRGLSELLGEVSKPAQEKTHEVQTLPIEFMQRGKYQPRKDMDPEKLKELSDSIAAQGIIQPIIVRKIAPDKYEIIAGERRWRAAQLAGLIEVPVLVKDIDDKAVMAVALIENIQREDLNALEEAEALHRLLDEFELTHQQIAESVGKSRTTITNLLRLLDLANEVKTMMSRGQLEMGHARALLGLEEAKQIEIAHKAIKQNLSVRAVEKLVREQNEEKSAVIKKIDPDTLRLQRELSEKTGAKVEINHQGNGKGKLVFSYTSLEELEGIIKKIN
ncbi:chromosome partitioning protein ParB [Methylomonas lenta]|uniref:Probable chromosome-partitioning protein ParB n=1 Tax=Methylomonas lenta TaxID=980561 RepID=A0A177N4F9_9GAMM|nr:ParB/RepB/Spo0J family partition protein [Methylomonas lenta]OAI12701.1 chromosome partitioning protein ParB [Methylomonas lenta]